MSRAAYLGLAVSTHCRRSDLCPKEEVTVMHAPRSFPALRHLHRVTRGLIAMAIGVAGLLPAAAAPAHAQNLPNPMELPADA